MAFASYQEDLMMAVDGYPARSDLTPESLPHPRVAATGGIAPWPAADRADDAGGGASRSGSQTGVIGARALALTPEVAGRRLPGSGPAVENEAQARDLVDE